MCQLNTSIFCLGESPPPTTNYAVFPALGELAEVSTSGGATAEPRPGKATFLILGLPCPVSTEEQVTLRIVMK